MTWTALTYGFGSQLTSTKMTQNQANFSALAAGDAGAPRIVGTAVGSYTADTATNSYLVGSCPVFITNTATISGANSGALVSFVAGQHGAVYISYYADGDNSPTPIGWLKNGSSVSSWVNCVTGAYHVNSSIAVSKGDVITLTTSLGNTATVSSVTIWSGTDPVSPMSLVGIHGMPA